MMARGRWPWLVLLAALLANASQAAVPGCAAIGALVDAATPTGPVLIPSYPTATEPALKGTAFVYDNALAVIALLACGDRPRAARIAAGLRSAATYDRFWHDGRIRNAYRAGPVPAATPPLLPGWWDAAAQRWDEDAYQVGTATGNVAWAALALIAMDPAHPDPAAVSLMRWVARATPTDHPVPGFDGGFFGEEPAPGRLGWESTEHNLDVAAAFRLLRGADPAFPAAEARAQGFVARMWDAGDGHFWIGTTADAHGINRAGSGIDAQLWPLLGLPDAPADWQRAKAWVRRHYAVQGGYGFDAAPDGIWTEGTAQAALALPDPSLLALLRAQRAPDGLLYATPDAHVHTGLALTPSSVTDDFLYFHLPHLGATAWAVLAETRTNPFQPR